MTDLDPQKPDLTVANARICNYKCGECGRESREQWIVHEKHHVAHLAADTSVRSGK